MNCKPGDHEYVEGFGMFPFDTLVYVHCGLSNVPEIAPKGTVIGDVSDPELKDRAIAARKARKEGKYPYKVG